MTDQLTEVDMVPGTVAQESPTGLLRWWRDPLSDDRRLQQKWLIRRWKTGCVLSSYEEWRDVPEESFYG